MDEQRKKGESGLLHWMLPPRVSDAAILEGLGNGDWADTFRHAVKRLRDRCSVRESVDLSTTDDWKLWERKAYGASSRQALLSAVS
jgi:hypothetical protein